MVDVLMGDKDMMDLLPVISGSADLVKDTVAAAPVDQEQLPAVTSALPVPSMVSFIMVSSLFIPV